MSDKQREKDRQQERKLKQLTRAMRLAAAENNRTHITALTRVLKQGSNRARLFKSGS